jgi:hypothetical protein
LWEEIENDDYNDLYTATYLDYGYASHEYSSRVRTKRQVKGSGWEYGVSDLDSRNFMEVCAAAC